jgi:DNA-binding transcriptional LysR family regulator
VLGSARWRCPQAVAILSVVDLKMPVSLALAWRRDNNSPLLARFIDEVQRTREVRAVNKG